MVYPLCVVASTNYFATADLSHWEVSYYHTLVGFVDQVVQQQPILIMLHPSVANWQAFAQGIKSSNATRRIPTLLVSDALSDHAHAPLHGIDFSTQESVFLADPNATLQEFARIPDATLLADLDCQCQEALPARGQEGIERFNSGAYYAQHDLFEAQWMAETRPVRDLYRAILQVGVGYYQIERGNYRGALKTLQKSVQWLLLLPDVCQTVNVKQLREDSFAVRAELQRLGETRLHEFDKSLLKPVQYINIP